MRHLHNISKSDSHSLYQLESSDKLSCFIASTPESRNICNDPFTVGLDYTSSLKTACSSVLRAISQSLPFELVEQRTVVLHILRGGLNFSLREALGEAFNWNLHPSAFISAQRQRITKDSEDWEIIENTYHKVYLPDESVIVLGDVIATGTTLNHTLNSLLETAKNSKKSLRGALLFTIGGEAAESLLLDFDSKARRLFPSYQGSALVYLEGAFGVPGPESELSIKLTGTDLLRVPATLAPEFLESQYELPSYPLERCTIYDAGSRAFWQPEYFEDLEDYWSSVLALAKEGLSFADYLKERFPSLNEERFESVSLQDLAENQLARLPSKAAG